MSLSTSNRMEQQATHEATRCAEYFAREVLDTIDDMETLGTPLDTMEFFHSISSCGRIHNAAGELSRELKAIPIN